MDSRIFSKVKKGEIIPIFTLKNIRGEKIGSDTFLRKKNLVILFFNRLKDICCRNYLQMLNDIYKELQCADAE